MATKTKKRIYEPLTKVIVAVSPPAKIGYVAEDSKGSTGLYGNGKWMVRVASSEEEAREHAYKLISYDRVLPYSDALWTAFSKLMDMALEIGDMFQELRTGKIPPKLRAVMQQSLFDERGEANQALVENE